MAPLLLGQLLYTSFDFVGFKILASTEIPTEIQQAFIEQVVYRYWDSYNPPSPGYRAAYLYQVSPEHSLFGWLYNDGLDDFGRSDVPYFVCYYLPGQLQPIQLENILICLCTGPVNLIDRQNFPDSLERLVTRDLWSYQPARTGVKIPPEMIEQSQIALKQGELLNLFVFTVEEQIQDALISDWDLISATRHKTSPPAIQGIPYPRKISQKTIIQQELPLTMQSIEDYQRILLSKVHSRDSQKAKPVFPFYDKLTIILGIITSISWLFNLVLGTYYILQVRFLVPTIKQRNSIPTRNAPLNPKITLTKTLTGHSDAVWSVVLTRNGKTLVSASADKTIEIWNLDTQKIVCTLQGHSNTVRAIALSPDGQILISGSGDKTIKIWNFHACKLIRTLASDSGPIWSVAIGNDGQTLVTGDEDGNIKIWNFPTGQLLRTIQGHEGRVFSIAISPNGETFATGSIDKTIKIWGLYTGGHLRTIAQHEDAVRSVIFSRDGRTLASASWDKTIKIWNLRTGEVLHTLVGHTSRVVTLALGSDNKTLVSGSLDNTVKIWNMQTGEFLQTLYGHSDWILAIATNPYKQILVSASKDKKIKIWQPQINQK